MKDPAHVQIKLVIHTHTQRQARKRHLRLGKGEHDYNPAAARGFLDIPPRKFFEIAPEAFGVQTFLLLQREHLSSTSSYDA